MDESKRATLEQLRQIILSVVPEAEQCISSLSLMPDDVVGYAGTKSALHFPIDKPLSDRLVRKLIEVRLREG